MKTTSVSLSLLAAATLVPRVRRELRKARRPLAKIVNQRRKPDFGVVTDPGGLFVLRTA